MLPRLNFHCDRRDVLPVGRPVYPCAGELTRQAGPRQSLVFAARLGPGRMSAARSETASRAATPVAAAGREARHSMRAAIDATPWTQGPFNHREEEHREIGRA